jgi:membrane-associated protein
MDALLEWLHHFRELINPNTLAQAGLLVLFVVVFAETGLMVGFFLPGDSLLFTAGLFCATGQFETHVGVLIGVLIVAAILGDQVGYLFGRRVGPALFTRSESWFFKPAYVERTRAFYDRHGGKTVILGRFVPIVRTFAPILAGVAQFDYRTFLIYNVVGGIVWVSSMTITGYVLGQFEWVRKNIEFIVLGIILVSVIPIVRTAWSEHLLARRKAREAAELNR